jgi:hypothetical protein
MHAAQGCSETIMFCNAKGDEGLQRRVAAEEEAAMASVRREVDALRQQHAAAAAEMQASLRRHIAQQEATKDDQQLIRWTWPDSSPGFSGPSLARILWLCVPTPRSNAGRAVVAGFEGAGVQGRWVVTTQGQIGRSAMAVHSGKCGVPCTAGHLKC